MLKLKSTLLVAAVVGLYGASAAAETEMGQEKQSGLKKASELMGKSVQDAQGEELGEIEDFVVDLEKGELSYVVLSTGGLLQSKEVGVSTDALRQAPEGDGYVADISQQELEAAEELPDQNLPEQPTLTAGAGGQTGMGQTEMGQTGTDQTEMGQTEMGQTETGEAQDFASLDQDGDGYISESEAQAGGEVSQQFDQVDQNADGQIDRTEFAAFEAQQPQQGSEMQQGERPEQPREYEEQDY